MELALELVNHAPPETVEELVAEIRVSEGARMAAEHRLVVAQREFDDALAAAWGPAAAGPRCGAAWGHWALALALLGTLVAALAAAACFLSAAPWGGACKAPGVPPRVPPAAPSAAFAVCSEAVRDAHTEVEAMRGLQKLQAAGYQRAMQDMTDWVTFLRELRSPTARPLPMEGTDGATSGSGALTRCLVAARRGRGALLKLARDQGTAQGTELARLREKVAALEKATTLLREARRAAGQRRAGLPPS